VTFTVESDLRRRCFSERLGLATDEELASTNIDMLGMQMSLDFSIIERKTAIDSHKTKNRCLLIEDDVPTRLNMHIFSLSRLLLVRPGVGVTPEFSISANGNGDNSVHRTSTRDALKTLKPNSCHIWVLSIDHKLEFTDFSGVLKQVVTSFPLILREGESFIHDLFIC